MEGSDAANDNSPPPESTADNSGSQAVETAQLDPPAETPPAAHNDTVVSDSGAAGRAATEQAAGAPASANGGTGGEGTRALDASNDKTAAGQAAHENAALSAQVAQGDPPADTPPTRDNVSRPVDGRPSDGKVPANENLPDVGVRFGPYTSGPLHDIPASRKPIDPETNEGSVAQTFRNGSYTERVTTEPMMLYRSFGNPEGALGRADAGDVSTPSYWTPTPPRGDQPLGQAMENSMSPVYGNDLRYAVAIEVPAGTQIFEGAAGPQAWGFGVPEGGDAPTYLDGPPIGDDSVGSWGGGGDQVVLLGDIPAEWVRALPADQPDPAAPKP